MKDFLFSSEDVAKGGDVVASKISASDYASQINLNHRQADNLRKFDRRFSSDSEGVITDPVLLKVLRKYVKSSHQFEEVRSYLKNLKDDDGEPYSQSLKRVGMLYDVISHLQSEDRNAMRWNENYRKAINTLKQLFPSKQLTHLTYDCDEAIVRYLPKKSTHSGFEYILSGKKKKGEYAEGIYENYVLEEQKALEHGTFNKLILPATRTQVSGAFEESSGQMTNKCKHKTRLVNMVDLYVIICELKYSKPIQNFMSKTEWYAGGKDDSEISRQFSDWRFRYNYFLSIDYSKFDQTIPAWLIEDAFDIIKGAFVDVGPEFDVIVHDFIHKDVLFDGSVYHIDKGVPSGSMFTQIIDSICNMIAILTYFNSIHVDDVKMCIMGDDNIIFTKDLIDKDSLSSYLLRNFGLIFNSSKSDDVKSVKESPHFLSKFYKYEGVWRHPNVILSKMIYPERKRIYYDKKDYVTPEHVILGYIYAYPLGMNELIDVPKFFRDNPSFSNGNILTKLDTRYLPGSLSYSLEYVRNWRQTMA